MLFDSDSVASSSPSPARCSTTDSRVMLRRRQPALAFAPSSSSAVSKDRLRDRQPAFKHLQTGSLTVSLVKTAVLRGAELSTMEEGIIFPTRWGPRLKWVGSELAPPFAKDLLITSVLRGYEELAVQNLSPKRSGQLMTDTWTEAQRKTEKKGSRVKAAIAMFPSAFRGSLLINLAIFTVEETFIVWAHLSAALKSKSKGQKDGKGKDVLAKRPSFLAETGETLARSMGSVMFEAAGATLGTLIYPGAGTYVVQLIGSLVCWVI